MSNSILMHRKHFHQIALALSEGYAAALAVNPAASPELADRLHRIHTGACKEIAKTLATQNPKFDLQKFLAVAGVIR